MNLSKIKIGDLVHSKDSQIPMKVVGIYEDGTIYLSKDDDSDDYEENIKDLTLIKSSTYDVRLQVELDELVERINKLKNFFQNKEFLNLEKEIENY